MDINKVTIMGHIGKDPTFHIMQGSGELCKFSVATTRRWKDKASGEKKEDTNWHSVVVFNSYLVDICHAWLQKGTRVYVEGELKTRTYEKDGEKKYITEIIVPQIKGEIFVVERGKDWDTDEMPGSARRGSGTTGGEARPAPTPIGGEDYDDDIPF